MLLGVIGFPLLFDKQPRSVAVDTPIDIPDRNKALPLALPTVPPKAQAPASAAPEVTPVASASVVPAPVEVSNKPKEEPDSDDMILE